MAVQVCGASEGDDMWVALWKNGQILWRARPARWRLASSQLWRCSGRLDYPKAGVGLVVCCWLGLWFDARSSRAARAYAPATCFCPMGPPAQGIFALRPVGIGLLRFVI